MKNASLNTPPPRWPVRKVGASTLAGLLRRSPLTVLCGPVGTAERAHTLRDGVMPLLQRRASDSPIAFDTDGAVALPFPDRRRAGAAGDAAGSRATIEVAVLLDNWLGQPIDELHNQLGALLCIAPLRVAAAGEALPQRLQALADRFGVRFLLILDRFEDALRAADSAAGGCRRFVDELAALLRAPQPAAHLLLSVADDALPLLNRFRERVPALEGQPVRLASDGGPAAGREAGESAAAPAQPTTAAAATESPRPAVRLVPPPSPAATGTARDALSLDTALPGQTPAAAAPADRDWTSSIESILARIAGKAGQASNRPAAAPDVAFDALFGADDEPTRPLVFAHEQGAGGGDGGGARGAAPAKAAATPGATAGAAPLPPAKPAVPPGHTEPATAHFAPAGAGPAGDAASAAAAAAQPSRDVPAPLAPTLAAEDAATSGPAASAAEPPADAAVADGATDAPTGARPDAPTTASTALFAAFGGDSGADPTTDTADPLAGDASGVTGDRVSPASDRAAPAADSAAPASDQAATAVDRIVPADDAATAASDRPAPTVARAVAADDRTAPANDPAPPASDHATPTHAITPPPAPRVAKRAWAAVAVAVPLLVWLVWPSPDGTDSQPIAASPPATSTAPAATPPRTAAAVIATAPSPSASPAAAEPPPGALAALPPTAAGRLSTPAVAALPSLPLAIDGDEGGAAQLAGDLAQWVGLPAGLNLRVEPASGWADALAAPRDGQRLAIVRYDALAAMRRESPGAGVRLVTPLVSEELYFITRADSPLKQVHDVERASRINVGPAQGGRAVTAQTAYQRLFDHPMMAGQAHFANRDAALRELLETRGVDVIVVVDPQPSAWLGRLSAAQRGAIKVLPLAADHPSTQRARRTYLPAVLHAGAGHAPVARETPTLAVMSFLVATGQPAGGAAADGGASLKVSDDAAPRGPADPADGLISRLASGLCRQLDGLRRDGHPKWQELQPGLALPAGWPYAAPAVAAFRNCGRAAAATAANAPADAPVRDAPAADPATPSPSPSPSPTRRTSPRGAST